MKNSTISNKKPIFIIAMSIMLCTFPFLFSCSNKVHHGPIAVSGVIDLSQIDWNRIDAVNLDGQWKFHWKHFYLPRQLKSAGPDKTAAFIDVPSKWTQNSIKGIKISPKGYGSYVADIHCNYKGPMAVKVSFPSTSYRIFINGKLAGEVGKAASNSLDGRPQFFSRVYPFHSNGNIIQLIIHVSNYDLNVGGILNSVILGKEDAVQKIQDNAIAFDLFLFGSLFIIGLYHLGLYYLRTKDQAPLWFGLFSLTLAARAVVTNEHYLYQVLPQWGFQTLVSIDFFAISLGIPLFTLFIESMFPKFTIKIIRNSLIALPIGYCLFVFLTTSSIYSDYVIVIQVTIILAAFYNLYILIMAMSKNLEGAKTITAAFFILFAAALNDILAATGIIHSLQLSSFGLFAFIFAQSFIISKNFSKAFARAEDLSTTLEKKVNERTMELELERNRLRNRNDIMENELKLAKKIQQHILPGKSPVDFIYTLYKPVEMVGGDFYDFLRFRNSNKIGIFLCDVSGHGVPAAFITSMIKTILLQSGPMKNEPAELFRSINELIYGNTNGYFITAFYGIYDADSGELSYCNGGHYFPLLISDTEVKELEGEKSVPLGIMNNKDLVYFNKNYESKKIILHQDINKLFMFTDGVLEATHHENIDLFFGDTDLHKTIHELSHLDCVEFIDALYRKLVSYCGTENFEDDICMISIDIK